MPNRQASNRRAETLQLLAAQGEVTTSELSRRFGVSRMTALRDLEDLEERRMLRRTHGGAVVGPLVTDDASAAGRLLETQERVAVAASAAALVRDGEAVFFDSSPVAYFTMRRLLDEARPMTVITNSVAVMTLVVRSENGNLTLIGLGGRLRTETDSFVGPYAIRDARAHFADRALLGAWIDPAGRLADPDADEAAVKHAMLENADAPILLLDSSARSGTHEIGGVERVALTIAHDVPAARTRPASR